MENETKWTQFWDMHSGGSQKEDYAHIYIEAPEEEAKIIFYNRFGHNPDRITCTCCGNDYSISDSDSIEQLTAFDRGCRYAYFRDGIMLSDEESEPIKYKRNNGLLSKWIEEPDRQYDPNKKLLTLDEYFNKKDVLAIYDKDILPEERIGELPEEGYIWH